MKIRITNTISEAWSGYDKAVAKCHLENYGMIFLDEYDCPIDNEYEVEELAAMMKKIQEVK